MNFENLFIGKNTLAEPLCADEVNKLNESLPLREKNIM